MEKCSGCETPKAACSSIKRLLHKIELHDTPYQPNKNVHDRAHSPLLRPTQLPPRAFTECLTSAGWFRFAFVRNPFTRVLSAYLDKIRRDRPEKAAILAALDRLGDQSDVLLAPEVSEREQGGRRALAEDEGPERLVELVGDPPGELEQLLASEG